MRNNKLFHTPVTNNAARKSNPGWPKANNAVNGTVTPEMKACGETKDKSAFFFPDLKITFFANCQIEADLKAERYRNAATKKLKR